MTLEPGVCHVVEEVLYGDAKGSGSPPQHLPAEPVVKLAGVPSHVLERAPETKTVGKYGGTSTTELLRAPCP